MVWCEGKKVKGRGMFFQKNLLHLFKAHLVVN